MKIDLYVHIVPGNEVLSLLNAISSKLDLINKKEDKAMVDYTKIQADITAQKTVLQGIVVGVKGLTDSNTALTQQVADLQAAIAANDPAAMQAAADALAQGIEDNTSLVANLIPAVTANTPDAGAATS